MKNFLQANSLILSLLVLAVLFLAYGLLFQRFTFFEDGPNLFRCSNITGECSKFSPSSIEYIR